jgi:hypothetical protein
MIKGKRQKFKEGAVVKIQLSEGRLVFGRLLPGVASMICIYDFVANKNLELPSIDVITNKPVLFYCGLFRAIITKGIYEIIGFKEFTEKEIHNIPPSFKQDMVNINDCVIFWNNGKERKAIPQECIGLERSSVWDEQGIIQRIEDHYNGKRNFHAELDKVILSQDDPRYLPPPQALRWDFEKQEFYRADK